MLKVLIVDDSPIDRALVSGLLKARKECQILEASNGVEGLALIESQQPQLVLTDLQMPEMNGLELVTIIKERFPNIPVILMTAQGSEEIAALALQKGAASYVPKRRLADDLVLTLERVETTSREERRRSLLMHHMTDTDTRFTLQSDPELVRMLVSHVLDQLRCIPLGDETERLRVGIAVEEGLNNALYRGNLQVLPEQGLRDRRRQSEVASQRLFEQPYCDRKIFVHFQITPQEARFVIRDEGPGFKVSECKSDKLLSAADHSQGRGIVLMRSIMDEVSFNAHGNEVTLVKRCIHVEDCDAEDG